MPERGPRWISTDTWAVKKSPSCQLLSGFAFAQPAKHRRQQCVLWLCCYIHMWVAAKLNFFKDKSATDVNLSSSFFHLNATHSAVVWMIVIQRTAVSFCTVMRLQLWRWLHAVHKLVSWMTRPKQFSYWGFLLLTSKVHLDSLVQNQCDWCAVNHKAHIKQKWVNWIVRLLLSPLLTERCSCVVAKLHWTDGSFFNMREVSRRIVIYLNIIRV